MKSKLCVMILTGLFILSGIAFAECTADQPNAEKEVKISESASKEAVPEAVDEKTKAAAEIPADCSKAAAPDKKVEMPATEK